MLGVPCFWAWSRGMWVTTGVSAITCVVSVLYWSHKIPLWLDLYSARTCTVYYVWLNLKSVKYRTGGFVLGGTFLIFYTLSCITNAVLFHALFHLFVMCSKFCVIMDPVRNPKTLGMSSAAEPCQVCH